jgi:hypothetical protein
VYPNHISTNCKDAISSLSVSNILFELLLSAIVAAELVITLVVVVVVVKGKAIPLQAWRGPEGSRRLRLPDFKTIGT